MQFKLFATTLALATLAHSQATLPASSCNTGSLQCCQALRSPTDPVVIALLTLLGINTNNVAPQVGVTCSPISVIGAGGNSCSAQPACCTDNTHAGVVALGCTPVNINL